MHIAAGRISSKRLSKILMHLDPLELTEGSDDENDEKVNEEGERLV